MNAKKLIAELTTLVEKHGDMEIMIPDDHGWFFESTVVDVGHLPKTKNGPEGFYMQIGSRR